MLLRAHSSALFLGIALPVLLHAQLPDGIVDTQPGEEQPPGPKESLEHISVPDGFHVSLFAGEPDVAQPIAINYDDRGRLWVLESFSYIEWKRTGKDRLLIFEDTDNDGTFDSRKIFWDKGNHTSGFQIGFGGVWLCDAPELLFIPDTDGDGIPDGEPQVVLDGWTTHAEHNFFNGLAWGPDGWLYGRHGIKKPSKVGIPGTPDEQRVDLSCSIWRYHPVKKRFEVVADGTVNPWGLDWNEEGEGFINTSVIDHLWHLVPGARYKRTTGNGTAPEHPYAYALMEPTSDHRHWSGGQTGRKDFGSNDAAGGGHSHCGMVIYQSDAWPQKYRGRAFFSNVLGQRINTDFLVPKQSAWVATHGEDFLRSSSQWFRAVDLRQGPHGEMMIAEWTDLGECHDRDGIHRTSGRLYEVWYGERHERKPINVAVLSTDELLGLMYHENVWWRRHARRNLHERFEKGEKLSDLQFEKLVATAKGNSICDAVSAIQILHLSKEEWYREIYAETQHDAVRIHLLTLVFTEEIPTDEQVAWLTEQVKDETSQRVLYRIAALMQRIPLAGRWSLAEAISRVEIEPGDRNFELMRWYGIEPLVPLDPSRAMDIAVQLGRSWLSGAIARRAADAGALEKVITFLQSSELENDTLGAVFSGLLQSLPAKTQMPSGWNSLYQKISENAGKDVREQSFQLAQRFGDPVAEKEMLALVLDPGTGRDERRNYMKMLVSASSKQLAKHIPELLQDPVLTAEAVRAEAVFPTPESAGRLLTLFQESGDSAILETLASRKDFADALVDAILDGEVAKDSISSFVARQVTMVASRKNELNSFLGIDEASEEKKVKLLKVWKKRLSDEYLAQADPAEGREVFQRVCSACHKMYGEGGEIGPDLTGSGRADLDYFLINVLFPSEDVVPEYQLVTLSLKDGRTLAGNIVEQNDRVITFRQANGERERIDTDSVVSKHTSPMSLMPPGLIDNLRREDVRDLFSFMQTKQPPE